MDDDALVTLDETSPLAYLRVPRARWQIPPTSTSRLQVP
jgi:hypothetical protein